MPQFLKSTALTLLCIVIGCAASWLAVYGFWVGVSIFHSVPIARFLNAIGELFLLPARGLFRCLGSALDQSTPMFDPGLYVTTNGVLVGFLLALFWRRLRGRKEETDPGSPVG